tara:strand:- start:737 stop:2068 length:1332 start_codon:yes stop_codon:yes gene_type:complete
VKDIQDNQKGLMALAKEKPSVVKKMGYDPESFAAGGIAMLQAGSGMFMNPIGDMGLDPDEAIEEFLKRQETEDGIKSMADQIKESIETPMEEGDIDYFIEKLRKGEPFDDPDDPFKVKESMDRMGSLSTPEDVMDIVPTRQEGPSELKSPLMENNPTARTMVARGGIGPLVQPNLPEIRRMSEGGDAFATELDKLRTLLESAGLSEEEIKQQLAAASLFAEQETTPGSAVYIPTDSPLKAVYRPYYSEVTKQYNLDRPIDPQTGKPIPFNPLLGPSASAVDFNLTPQRLAGVEYANALMPAKTQGIGPLAKDIGPVSPPAQAKPIGAPQAPQQPINNIPLDVIEEIRNRPKMNLAMMAEGGMTMDGQYFPDLDDLITGPGGERDDKIPAMLSDGEFVTNARAVRGIGALAGAPMNDPFAQRMEGAKQMYAMQKAAEDYMKRMR